ncbi:hypothetical protein [Parasulfitobacter algicola]|uniref:Nucleotide-diphospho-sugar transferase domain-containing protein n=1 Tax=Parasulfitobacter algicola TaxID=2614809 RepID=A0ABX2IXK3_9RHOB|nr:hypothetical protein [Sulfitobacter algicola]NSX55063.1 hypothetical protein [Sulfitobacter algicola]
MRDVHPDTPIDLFTDIECADTGPFDRIVPLQRSWFRPKLEALRRSRFDRTIYLDTDIFVLADITDVFEILLKFDIVGAHNEKRSGTRGINIWNENIPPAFPQINGGVLGIAKSDKTDKFIRDVEDALMNHGLKQDQVPIRELLWNGDLRPWVLPVEYNVMSTRLIENMRPRKHTAPRLLHLQGFHRHLRKDVKQQQNLGDILPSRHISKLQKLLAQDRTLTGRRYVDLSIHKKTIFQKLSAMFDKL